MTSPTKVPPRPGSGAARRAKAAKQKARSDKRRSSLPIFVALGAVVAIALVVAIAVSGGDSQPADDGVSQSRPVVVSGDALAKQPDSGEDPAVGAIAPTVTGEGFAGQSMSLPVKGSPTLTIFVAHWCPHCRKEVPLLTAWAAAGDVPKGVEVFAVSTSVDPASVNYPPSDWLEREAFPFGVLVDSSKNEAAAAMGVTGFPFFVMTDADGKVLWRASGEIPMDQLTTMIEDSLPAS